MSGKNGHRGWGHVRQLTNKSKRWQASYIGPDGNRHTAPITFTQKTDAESWLGSERRMIERDALGESEWTSPKEREMVKRAVTVSLSDYAKRNLAARDLKPRTKIQYDLLIKSHIEPELGKLPINRITTQTVKTWYSKTLVGKPRMRAQAYNLLRSLMAGAVNDGLLQSNPVNIAGAGKSKTELEVRILESEQVAQLADKIEDQYKAFILLAAWCGLRYGETSALQRGDFIRDPEGNLVKLRIDRTVSHKGGCNVGLPKGNKKRTAQIPPHIRDAVEHHLSTYVDLPDDSLLFKGQVTACGHMSATAFGTRFKKAITTVGRTDVRIHDLRHFAGSMASRVGMPIEVRNYLGHADVDMSLHYSHMVSGREQEMATQMSKLVGWSDPAQHADSTNQTA